MNLADWRRRIDEIDRKLVELLNERSTCALEIGKLKQQANLPLYQPDREREVLENAEHNNGGRPHADTACPFFFRPMSQRPSLGAGPQPQESAGRTSEQEIELL